MLSFLHYFVYGFICVCYLFISDGPDNVSLTPNDGQTVDEHGPMNEIICNAQCFPNCTYIWSKQGQSAAVSTANTLSFGSSVPRDYAGIYSCTVTNPATLRNGSVRVTVQVRCK